jgi:hypothetical protein
MWTGLMLGTALAVLAMVNGARLKVGGTPSLIGVFLGGLIVWLLVVGLTTLAAELLRRHHRTIGRAAGHQAGRAAAGGWRLARRHGGRGAHAVGRWADDRWHGRQSGSQPGPVREPVSLGTALNPARWLPRRQPQAPAAVPPAAGSRPAPGKPAADPDPTPAGGFPAVPADGTAAASGGAWGAPDPGADCGTGPWMLAVRRKDGQPYYGGPGGSQFGTAVVHDREDLRRRLAAAAADPGTEVRVAPVKLTDPELAQNLGPAAEADIKRQVSDMFADADIVPEEVIVGADGTVTLDRRLNPNGRYEQAAPVTGEVRWSPFRGAPLAYAVHPFPTRTSVPDPVPADVTEGVRRHVCGLPGAADEGLQPADVTVGPYGLILVDRSRTHHGETAWDGLRWVPLPDGSVAVTATWAPAPSTRVPATSPGSGAVPPSDTENQHGGTSMTAPTTREHVPADYTHLGSFNVQRRTARTAAAPEPNGVWKHVISSTHGFEPESDSHLLGWMAGEAGGMSGYAEEIADVYETAVNTIGLDPVAMQALHDYADAAATAAEAMAKARQRFADHYSEVRQFTANGGVLPFNGRWMTGEGD